MNLIRHDLMLDMAGIPETHDILKKISFHPKVNFLGVVGREKIKEILGSSLIGIVTLHPTPNHVESYPVKMFEYMAAGIPIVASDFTLWKDIITTVDCGICVDPRNPQKIAEAVTWLYENPTDAKKMGENGKKAIITKYNWETESEKLFDLYSELSIK
jgi:glycosyltransferase involved in cell wall biosynthesis